MHISTLLPFLFGYIALTVSQLPKKKSEVDNVNQFFLAMYNQSFDSTKNTVISPCAVRSILRMVHPAAQPDLKKKMTEILVLPPNTEQTIANQNLSKAFSSVLIFDNVVFLQKEMRLQKYLKQTNGLKVHRTNFANKNQAARQINKWASKQSQGRITEYISPSQIHDDIQLVLLNLIYFKAEWVHQFSDRWTVVKKFYANDDQTHKVNMMDHEADYRYYYDQTKNVKFLEMPYRPKNRFVMWVLLPGKGQTLESLVNSLTAEYLTDLRKKAKMQFVRVRLPKFTINYEFDVKEVLERMGLESLFEPGAFNVVRNRQSKVGDVFQRVFINVNEKGTEASAATRLAASSRSLRFPENFSCNRPFLFMLVTQNRVMFIGHYAKPTEEAVGPVEDDDSVDE